jgi:proteasome lid subunit RPN8/RPN11
VISRTLKVTPKLIADIEARARQDYPKETCGFLAGAWEAEEVARLTHILPTRNQHFSNPHRHFVIDSLTYRQAEQIAAKHKLLLLGVFHSHPDGNSEPSASDARYAWPEWFYWITPVFKEVCGPSEAWFRSADANDWIGVMIDSS